MTHLEVWAVTGLMLVLGILEALAGRLWRGRPREELWVDVLSLAQFAILIKPAIVWMAAQAVIWLSPSWTPLASWPLPWAVLAYVLLADLLHYGYHRLAHSSALFWQLHKTHHTATAMSISVSYRENWVYYLLMPDLWLAGLLVALGGAEFVLIGQLIFGLANVLIHSAFAWDAWLFRHRWVAPAGRVLERLVQLPSTHRAHHALVDAQGRPPQVNFGQLLMIWDVMLGTAHLPHGRSPAAYGVDADQQASWMRLLWVPGRTGRER
ncbi:sterol desaturase family protein [Mitsuaria sp. WAJ17]|uniref:sterol desaturase family protein n=1 Tax=Mitsuaria sp. WAJ17 TaxID=2761452 RepID=UPI0016033794|nr:sterol desaturase family protein [Mitsuaria sp. WAJ17]MBB2487725.1 sterol desaturase family protein [Mitsuaria sp. WAJ17]